MKFSEKLQKMRKDMNLSQEQLADMLDVSRQSVSKWESGQTYPEMDKLIAMCKIFKCSLDDLTNDEVTDINIKNKQKNNFTNIIDEMLDLINRTFDMFKKMKSKDILKLIIELMVLLLIFVICKIPINYIYNQTEQIFNNLPGNTGNIFSGVLNLILTISYFILCIIIFVYIYKIRYLDKYDNIELPDNLENNYNNDTENKEVIIPNKTNKKTKEHSFAIFNTLGNIVMVFIKFILFVISIPFALSLVMLFACLVLSIILIFKGVVFIGIIIGIISLIFFNLLLLYLLVSFIFDKKTNIKIIFITLFVSISGIGIASGITIYDVTNIDYINDIKEYKKTTLIKEFDMNDNLMIENYYKNITYVEDNNLNNKLIIDIKYNKDYTNFNVIKNDDCIYIHNNPNDVAIKDVVDMIISNLSDKKFYNYNKLFAGEIIIKTSASNIEKLNNNYEKYYDSIREDDYNSLINEYENSLTEKDNKIESLEEEIWQLNEKIEEYKNKIQEYKDNVNSIINE